jgi:hypothetical protein
LLVPNITCCDGVAKSEVATLGVTFCYFVYIGVPWSICPKSGVLSRGSNDRRRDARRRLSNFLPNGITWFTCDKYGCLVGVGFPSSFPVWSQGSPALNMASFGDVSTEGVDTRHDAWRWFSMSCSMAFRRLSVPNMPSFSGFMIFGVVTLGDGFLASVVWRPKASTGFIFSL